MATTRIPDEYRKDAFPVVTLTDAELAEIVPKACPACGTPVVLEVDATSYGVAEWVDRDADEPEITWDTLDSQGSPTPGDMTYLYVYGWFCPKCADKGDQDFDCLVRVVFL